MARPSQLHCTSCRHSVVILRILFLVHISKTFRATLYSLIRGAASRREASPFATAEILKNVVRNSGTSISTLGANTAACVSKTMTETIHTCRVSKWFNDSTDLVFRCIRFLTYLKTKLKEPSSTTSRWSFLVGQIRLFAHVRFTRTSFHDSMGYSFTPGLDIFF